MYPRFTEKGSPLLYSPLQNNFLLLIKLKQNRQVQLCLIETAHKKIFPAPGETVSINTQYLKTISSLKTFPAYTKFSFLQIKLFLSHYPTLDKNTKNLYVRGLSLKAGSLTCGIVSHTFLPDNLIPHIYSLTFEPDNQSFYRYSQTFDMYSLTFYRYSSTLKTDSLTLRRYSETLNRYSPTLDRYVSTLDRYSETFSRCSVTFYMDSETFYRKGQNFNKKATNNSLSSFNSNSNNNNSQNSLIKKGVRK